MGKIDGLEEAVVELMQRQDEIKTIWNHEIVGEELHGSWKESSVLNELVGLLSKLEASAHDSIGKRKRERDGSDSEGTLETTFHRDLEYVIQSARISADRRPRESLLAQVGHSRAVSGLSNPTPTKIVAKSTITSISGSGSGDSISYLSTLSFPARTPSLLELYFSHTHCWFPILERHHILRISYSCSSSQQRPESISSSDLATFWALLAYVDNQYAHISSEPRAAREMDAAEMLAVAMKLMPPFGNYLFEIGHVQALLLIALNSIGSSWNRAWIVIGHAVRIAIDLNVGQVAARGKHILFGCFILDTLISARLGRKPHMRREEITQLGHLEEDGLEEWDPWTNSQGSSHAYANARGPAFAISCFNRLCDVCAILNDIICDTSSGIERQSFCQRQSKCLAGLFKKLNLLDQSTNLDPSQQHGTPPHRTYLALLYFTAQLALHLHAQSSSEQRPSDAFARHACEILVLLTQHAQSIGLAVSPPLLEYAMGLSLDGATLARSHFGDTAGLPTFEFWALKMAQHVDEIKSLWPVFNSLSDTLADEERRGRRSFTLPTTPATYQMNQRLLTTASLPAPANMPVTPDAASGTVVQPNLNFWEATSSSAMTSSIREQVPPSFDMMMTDITIPTPSSVGMPAGLAMPATSQTSPSFQGDDVDAIFDDLAHLDTTEWTNNREQGLREFGFADDSTFQAFCNDPDRLLDRATPFDPSSMDDNATGFWPPPGFFPEHFEETDPHMEASQILQSLAGNDQYPTLPESVGW
jgi:hypothetical protein